MDDDAGHRLEALVEQIAPVLKAGSMNDAGLRMIVQALELKGFVRAPDTFYAGNLNAAYVREGDGKGDFLLMPEKHLDEASYFRGRTDQRAVPLAPSAALERMGRYNQMRGLSYTSQIGTILGCGAAGFFGLYYLGSATAPDTIPQLKWYCAGFGGVLGTLGGVMWNYFRSVGDQVVGMVSPRYAASSRTVRNLRESFKETDGFYAYARALDIKLGK